MQCGVEKRIVRSVRMVVVRCFKCGEEGHKCRECPLWERKVKRVAHPKKGKAHQGERDAACVATPQKVQQIERLAHFKGRKVQKVRRVEEERAACPEKGEAQQEWRRSTIEELKRRAKEHCGKGIC